jgi:hypothetical protein
MLCHSHSRSFSNKLSNLFQLPSFSRFARCDISLHAKEAVLTNPRLSNFLAFSFPLDFDPSIEVSVFAACSIRRLAPYENDVIREHPHVEGRHPMMAKRIPRQL